LILLVFLPIKFEILLSSHAVYFSVFVVMGVCQADLDVVLVLDIVPMARRRSDSLVINDGYGNFDVDSFHGGTLFGHLLVDLDRYVNLHWYILRDGYFAFFEHLDLHRHVNHDLLLNLDGHLDLDHLVNDSRDFVLLLDVDDLGHLMGDRFEDSLGFFNNLLDLDHGRHLDGHSLDVVFGDHGLLHSRY
jgi:hypothetical protein